MPIKNYSTLKKPENSVSEIQKILAKHGASKIMIDYEEGEPSSISFSINTLGKDIGYKLPSNWRGVLRVLNADKKVPSRLRNNDHAKKVSWRIIKDWIDSQMALIESRQADVSQIFLPYALNSEGKTLYEVFQNNPQLLIGQ